MGGVFSEQSACTDCSEKTITKGNSMSDWTAGYIAEIGYTYGYYGELNPLRLRLAFLSAGLAFPEVGTACELGFGQGMSTNMHAAASTTQWSGTDFNPAHAAFAQQLGQASGTDVRLYDEAFVEFCNRTDLPDYDYIGLHGIWSWISSENRAIIVDFIRRKLKVGGVLYISYNTQPGWSAMVPLRDLLTEYAEVMGSPGQGIAARIDGALAFADQLLATNPGFAKANQQVVERLKKIKTQSRNYLAHEYFNRDWAPMAFSRMAEWLSPAKLNYACSAHLIDHIDQINLTVEQQELLNAIPDAMFRQTVRDYCINQQFRRDYWVKGARKLNQLERAELFRMQRVILTTPRAEVSLKVNSSLGEAEMQASVYNPVLDALADYQPKTIAAIEDAVKDQKINFGQAVQALLILVGSGTVQPTEDEASIRAATKRTQNLNLYLYNKARNNSELNYLASPVTGGGITVPRFHQLFLLAMTEGKTEASQMAEAVWTLLKLQGQRIVKEEKMLQTEAETLAHLTEEAQVFISTRLPILKALGIA